MKKIILTISTLLILSGLTGCIRYTDMPEQTQEREVSILDFEEIGSCKTIVCGGRIYRHSKTGVLYIVSYKGDIQIMLDSDGKPLTL